jgi:hypothetical protein
MVINTGERRRSVTEGKRKRRDQKAEKRRGRTRGEETKDERQISTAYILS